MKMMKNTTMKLASAALTTCLCASVIAGATYALLTDEAQVDIAVTSGKVAVSALVDESTLKCYSVKKDDSGDLYVEGYGNYSYVEQNGSTFYCGGSVNWDGTNSKLNIVKMAAGDKVTFDIKVTNTSTIDVMYKVVQTISGELKNDLEVTAEYDGKDLTDNYSLWSTPNNSNVGETRTISVTVGLPVTYTNSDTESGAINFSVYAIQSNGIGISSDDDTDVDITTPGDDNGGNTGDDTDDNTGENGGETTNKIANFADDFTTETQNGAWKYGHVNYVWGENETFTFIQSENYSDEAWTADGVEIKAGWINAGGMTTVAYTADEEKEVEITLKFTGGTESTRLALRVGIMDSEGNLYENPSYNSNSESNVLEYTSTITLNAGDTIYFIFSNENVDDESAYPNGDLSIIISEQ